MSQQSRGLGKGLDALLDGFNSHRSDSEVRLIPLESIEPNPYQPRKTFSDSALKDLADSIAIQGVLQPILVREKADQKDSYELIAGERRWRASKLAKVKLIPAIVKNLSDNECLVVAMIENLQREDLNPIEEALGLQVLQKKLQLNQEKLAEKVGKSRPAVANSLRLLQLPETIQQALVSNDISSGHARALLILDRDNQQELFRRIKENGLSVRQTEAAVAYWKEHETLPEATAVKQQPSRARAKSGASESAPTDAALEALEKELSDNLSLPVKTKGSRDKGQIVIRYTSKNQLQQLMSSFGITIAFDDAE